MISAARCWMGQNGLRNSSYHRLCAESKGQGDHELCSRAISGTFEQVHFLPKMAINGLANIGNLWKLPILARNELAKNSNLSEPPDLKIA